MKKMRKGFTLVELLIVVAILGVLSAAMTINMSGATAKAKAASIKANFDICKTAATTYYASHIDATGLSSTTADAVMKATVPNWTATTGLQKGVVTYTATGTTPKEWKIVAKYTGDTSAKEIDELLIDGTVITEHKEGETPAKVVGSCEMLLIDELQ